MAEDSSPVAGEAAAAGRPQHDFGLTSELIDEVQATIESGDLESVRAIVAPLHFADLADLIETLSLEERRRLVEAIRAHFDPNLLTELDEPIREQVVEQIDTFDLATAIARLESDDALYLIDQLDESRRRAVMQAMPTALRRMLEEGLAYPEASAGRLMQREVVVVPSFWTVGETTDFIRESHDLPENFYDVYVVDPRHRPVGTIPLNRLLRRSRSAKVSDVMESRVVHIPVAMDQEEVAELFRKQDLVSAPVVDPADRLIGVITVDDVVDVIDEEAEEDMMRLSGAIDRGIHDSAFATAKRRQSWLLITLFNTILASIVISRFEESIERIVALAILMPIVAAMGGNAGMQVVTVVVRALATRDLTSANTLRVIIRELAVGAMNGVVFAAIMATIASLWFGDLGLGVVLGSAMIFNMVWAGIAGTLIPLTLNALKVDPAVAAGPFLTTTTDVFGFFVFLGLASVFLL